MTDINDGLVPTKGGRRITPETQEAAIAAHAKATAKINGDSERVRDIDVERDDEVPKKVNSGEKLAMAGVIALIVGGALALWGLNKSPQPLPAVTSTEVVTSTTATPTTMTKTETRTETPPARTVTETQVARSSNRSELPQNTDESSANPSTTSPEAPVPQPTNTATQSSSSSAADCIAKYESGGNVNAVNPSSGASGKWQFLDSTWQSVTGLPGKASDYSEAQQRAAFDKLWANGAGASHWVTAGKCGY